MMESDTLKQRLNATSMNECKLEQMCPYYLGVLDIPEEYKEQYCRGEYQWCGRYLTYVTVERERHARFGGVMPNRDDFK